MAKSQATTPNSTSHNLSGIRKVLGFIYHNNKPWAVPYYILKGVIFQLFKRITNRVFSKRLFNGKEIFIFPKCVISSFLVYSHIPDHLEINLLRELANEDTVFLDIGANIGSYSIMLMDVVGEIHAFEPHPVTASRCKMNFLLNGYPAQTVHQLALNDF